MYFDNKNAITLMKTKKRQKVDRAQIIYNSLCSELDRWYKYVKDNKGDNDTCQFTLILEFKKLISICLPKGKSTKTTGQGKEN
jgi:hypothetical protein